SCRSVHSRCKPSREPPPGRAERRRADRSRSARGKIAGGAIRRGLLAPLPGERKPAIAPTTKSRIECWNCARSRKLGEVRAALRIALHQPDIAQKTGTILRLCACLGVEAHIVEPAGFPASDRAFRRAGMDYLDHVVVVRHRSFAEFESWRGREKLRLVLLTT